MPRLPKNSRRRHKLFHGRRRSDEPRGTVPLIDALALNERFVVVYSATLEGAWHFPAQTPPVSMANGSPADDIGFVRLLIDALIAERISDPARIYVSSVSQG